VRKDFFSNANQPCRRSHCQRNLSMDLRFLRTIGSSYGEDCKSVVIMGAWLRTMTASYFSQQHLFLHVF
jgi:hypothetical protein